MTAPTETHSYVCEHCGATEQWSCRCWEAEAGRYHHQHAAASSPDVSQPRQPVVWGCAEHRTPAGQACRGCADQGELFARAATPRAYWKDPYLARL